MLVLPTAPEWVKMAFGLHEAPTFLRPLPTVPAVSSEAVQPIVALLSDSPGGDPTQYMAEKALTQHDLDWRYLTFEVLPEQLGDAVRGIRALGFRGAHCASHHKRPIVALLDRLSQTAERIGAANVVLRENGDLVGENTEGRGLLQSLGRHGIDDPAGKRVVLLGGGRAARAVAVELAAAGIGALTIVNRTELHARQLADLVGEQFETEVSVSAWVEDFALPPETDLLVHATTLVDDNPSVVLPIDSESLRPTTCVADMTWRAPRSWLLREAAERGCPTIDGLEMYVEQVAEAIRLWTGVLPETYGMREAAEEFLEL